MFKEAWFADDEWAAETGFNSSRGTKGVLFRPGYREVEMEPKNVLSKYQEKRSSEETRKKSGLGVALPETPPDAVEEHPQNNCHADAESWRDWSHFSTIFSSRSFALASVL